MDVYIKPYKKIVLIGRKNVYVKDLCEILPNDEKIKNLIVTKIKEDYKKNYIVDVLEIINIIKNLDKNNTVYNVGESDTVIEYIPKEKKKSKIFTLFKVCIITVILFGGAATTIMAFHNETALPKVFDTYFKIFFGYSAKNPAIIDIPYSIGLALGIIIFFNHVFGKSFSGDPTPLEVEMMKYENDVTSAEKDILAGGHGQFKKKGGDDNGNN